MASNGYVRVCCSRCLFYESDREYGEFCNLYGEVWDATSMRWVSANDCENNPLMKEKHHEKCEHYTSKRELKNQIREKFGIEKINYEPSIIGDFI